MAEIIYEYYDPIKMKKVQVKRTAHGRVIFEGSHRYGTTMQVPPDHVKGLIKALKSLNRAKEVTPEEFDDTHLERHMAKEVKPIHQPRRRRW